MKTHQVIQALVNGKFDVDVAKQLGPHVAKLVSLVEEMQAQSTDGEVPKTPVASGEGGAAAMLWTGEENPTYNDFVLWAPRRPNLAQLIMKDNPASIKKQMKK